MYSNAAMAESAALRSADSISRTALSSEKDREQEKSCGRRGEEITADASSDDGHESNSSVSSSLLDNADPSALDGGSAHKIKKDADGKQPTFSLREKSRIPVGMYLSFACILSLLYSSGIVTHFDVIMGGLSSSLHLSQGVQSTVQGIVDLFFGSACAAACWVERTQALLMTGVAGSVAYVLLYIPFRAGFWTGLRASRHKVHRYMGLSFLILYAVAWLEFVSDYEGGASRSFLPLAIALNGE